MDRAAATLWRGRTLLVRTVSFGTPGKILIFTLWGRSAWWFDPKPSDSICLPESGPTNELGTIRQSANHSSQSHSDVGWKERDKRVWTGSFLWMYSRRPFFTLGLYQRPEKDCCWNSQCLPFSQPNMYVTCLYFIYPWI